MLIINLLGALLIAAIIYWFWLYKPKQIHSQDNKITIVVNGGAYQPSQITVNANDAVELIFDRQDSAPCAETVIFPQLDISENLKMGENNTVKLPALDKGNYDFHCQMKMYTGVIIAK